MKTRVPSIKALTKAFPDANAILIRDLLTNFESVEQYLNNHGLCARFYSPPEPRYAYMLALNHALGFHGVEHAGQGGERGFTYLNTGDAYGVTLIQFDDKDSIFISTWGDIVENGRYR